MERTDRPPGPRDLSPQAQALLMLAAAAREVADAAYGLAADLDNTDPAGVTNRIRRARELVIHAMVVRRMRVISELLGGADVAEVAKALDLSLLTVQSDFGLAVQMMQHPPGPVDLQCLDDSAPGFRHDPDPWGTASTLDAWLGRHADFREIGVPGPVTQALLATTPAQPPPPQM